MAQCHVLEHQWIRIIMSNNDAMEQTHLWFAMYEFARVEVES